jgi:hypothetical protein
VHGLLEVQDTPESAPPPSLSGGIGVRSIDHDVPFQCSTRGPVAFTFATPTAMQSLVDRHDTPDSSVLAGRRGSRTGWIDQSAAAADCAPTAATTPAPTRSII